jgi:hypothetical protein
MDSGFWYRFDANFLQREVSATIRPELSGAAREAYSIRLRHLHHRYKPTSIRLNIQARPEATKDPSDQSAHSRPDSPGCSVWRALRLLFTRVLN